MKKEKFIVLLGVTMVVAVGASSVTAKNREKEYADIVTKLETEIDRKEEALSTLRKEQDNQFLKYEETIEKLQEDKIELTKLLGEKNIESVFVATKNYENEVYLHNTEEKATETSMFFHEGDYAFFINYEGNIDFPEVTANGEKIELQSETENCLAFNYKITDNVLIKITYQYKEVKVEKYLKIIKSAT